MKLLAIDPGNEQSGWVLYNTVSGLPEDWEKADNDDVLSLVDWVGADRLAIERIASYGMAVGASVFETCVWSGRFIERWLRVDMPQRPEPIRVYRKDVKLHLCNSPRAKDANVRQAIVDLYGGKEKAIGLKKTPGPLYGMTKDCWAAMGVALTAAALPEVQAK